jgi:hypothetical protein
MFNLPVERHDARVPGTDHPEPRHLDRAAVVLYRGACHHAQCNPSPADLAIPNGMIDARFHALMRLGVPSAAPTPEGDLALPIGNPRVRAIQRNPPLAGTLVPDDIATAFADGISHGPTLPHIYRFTNHARRNNVINTP